MECNHHLIMRERGIRAGHGLSWRRLGFLFPKIHAPESFPQRSRSGQGLYAIIIVRVLRFDPQGQSERHEHVSLVFVMLNHIIESIILPCLSEAFTLGREKNDRVITLCSSLCDLCIKIDLKLKEIGAASKPLFAAKSGHQKAALPAGDGDRCHNLTFPPILIVVRDLRRKRGGHRRRVVVLRGNI
jgi:hypothetical protein